MTDAQADLTERARALKPYKHMEGLSKDEQLHNAAGLIDYLRAALVALQSEREAAAAEARRAACKAICYGCRTGQELVEDRGTLMHRHPDTGKLYLNCNAEDIHRLASPAPQCPHTVLIDGVCASCGQQALASPAPQEEQG